MVGFLRNRARVVFTAFAVAGLGETVLGDIIDVPADFATIQAAIDAAVDTDEIVVAPGTYFGPFNTPVGRERSIDVEVVQNFARILG